MSFTLRAAVLAATIGSVACGATTSNPGPDTMPTATSDTTQTAPTGPAEVSNANPGTIPVGQELDVRLQESLSSDTATVEQRFEATTAVDLMQNGRVLVPSGSVVRGVVSGVEEAGRVDRKGSLTLSFDQLVVSGQTHNIRGTATQVFESGGIREEAGTIGAGAGVGAIVGGILGGLKGALVGAIVGSGGVIAATEGKDVTLPAGTIVRVRLNSAVNVR